ncbi:MAG: 50S ribosomal protein L11 methyltransferase [Bacteroidales bacterium]|nr:50S ribosomal protein L11 methyltransferase [Bacteroidales bacterium]
MNYIESEFNISPADPGREILMALLAEEGYESFEDSPEGLKGYIPANLYSAGTVERIINRLSVGFRIEFRDNIVPAQNWNAIWEKGYEPVTVEGRLRIRAPFHKKAEGFPLEIIIEPKMSFGTGHHQTTTLMAGMMLDQDFISKKVLDLGCGTGILSVLAEKLGASAVLAVDNDKGACVNAAENVNGNNCHRITVTQGDIHFFTDMHAGFDIILANINRNVLLEYMPVFGSGLEKNGTLMISGFFSGDSAILHEAAIARGFRVALEKHMDNWAAIMYNKV